MKKKILLFLLVAILGLTACANKEEDDNKIEGIDKDFSKYEEATIVSVNENNILVLKNDQENPALVEINTNNSKIYLDKKEASRKDLLEGMIVKLDFSGPMMMSYPGKINSEYILAKSLKPNQINDKIGFYVQVVKDIIKDEKTLSDQIKSIALNLDDAPVKLNEGEKNALEYKLKDSLQKEILFTDSKKFDEKELEDTLLITFNSNDKEEKKSDTSFKIKVERSGETIKKFDSVIADWDEKGVLKKIEYK